MSRPRIKIFNHRAKDAPRGTLIGENPNEEHEVRALVQEAARAAASFKQQAYEIAGTFRGPGAWLQVKRALNSLD